MDGPYNKQLSRTKSKQADLLARSFGVETDGVGTALTLGRAARKVGISTSEKTQEELFGDLVQEYSNIQIKKNIQVVADTSRPPPTEINSFKRIDPKKEKEASIDNSTTIRTSRQFFVWAGGEAGTVTVPVDFDFKPV